MTAPQGGVLRASGLSYRYRRDRRAVSGVDLAVGWGDLVGIIGPNGSGKSTLLRLLAGIVAPDRGTLVWGVEERRRISVVLDRLPFVRSLSGFENLALTLALRGVDPGPGEEAAETWLAAFGLSDRAGDPVADYSAGMRRRLALAEAFAPDPRLLLLDEPTLGLDPEGRAALGLAVRRAVAAGSAVALTSNDATFVTATCDRVLFLHRGEPVAEGRPRELIEALGQPTILEVDLRPEDADVARKRSARALPPRLEALSSGAGTLRFASAARTAPLPALCAWLEAGGHAIRAIRIREPDLGDVFHQLTGAALSAESEPPGRQTGVRAGGHREERTPQVLDE